MSAPIDPRDVVVARTALFVGSRLAEDEVEVLYSYPERVDLEARYSPGFFRRLENITGGTKDAMLREAMTCAQTPADRALIERLIAEETL